MRDWIEEEHFVVVGLVLRYAGTKALSCFFSHDISCDVFGQDVRVLCCLRDRLLGWKRILGSVSCIQ
jgi:hypothetical protein